MTEILIGSGLIGLLTITVSILFKGQNKKIETLDQCKTDKDLCKVVHVNLNESIIEIKSDLKDMRKAVQGINTSLARMNGGM